MDRERRLEKIHEKEKEEEQEYQRKLEQQQAQEYQRKKKLEELEKERVAQEERERESAENKHVETLLNQADQQRLLQDQQNEIEREAREAQKEKIKRNREKRLQKIKKAKAGGHAVDAADLEEKPQAVRIVRSTTLDAMSPDDIADQVARGTVAVSGASTELVGGGSNQVVMSPEQAAQIEARLKKIAEDRQKMEEAQLELQRKAAEQQEKVDAAEREEKKNILTQLFKLEQLVKVVTEGASQWRGQLHVADWDRADEKEGRTQGSDPIATRVSDMKASQFVLYRYARLLVETLCGSGLVKIPAGANRKEGEALTHPTVMIATYLPARMVITLFLLLCQFYSRTLILLLF